MILKIILGLGGLGVMVFFHELGHFIAAKLSGIVVEAFTLGWGKKLVSCRFRGTEYCIAMLPLGGSCKMKGEEAMRDALEAGEGRPRGGEGTFYGASPGKRIFVAAAGPAMNFLFAIFAFSAVWLIGFSYSTFDNRIVLASDFSSRSGDSVSYPATQAGLKTGDYITAVDSQPIATFRDLQDAIALQPEKNLAVEYTRNGVPGSLRVTPFLNKSTGAGGIGVYPWVEPVIAAVRKESAAEIAGLKAGDRILAVNGTDVPHTRFLDMVIEESPFHNLNLLCERDGKTFETKIILYADEEGRLNTGISFRASQVSSPRVGIAAALGKGFNETFDTLFITVKSLGLLFRGIDLSQAVSGPLRITYFVGEVATTGFSKNFATGVTSILNFLGLLSVALFFMNLLPIPVLDGGQIVLFLFEVILRKPLSLRFVYRYQFVGWFFVLLLVILSTMSDVLYFFRS